MDSETYPEACMKYHITYNGSKLISSDGYLWKAPKGADEVDVLTAKVLNSIVEQANHHDPIQVILEGLGDSVVIGKIPQDTSDDCFVG